jgi:hypothetical protein
MRLDSDMKAKLWIGLSLLGGLTMTTSSAYSNEATTAEGTTSEQVTAQAIEMYQQANALYLDQKFAEAYILYKAAWSLRPNYKLAGNLGNCEYDLRKYRDAAEHLAFALRENPEQGIAATKTFFAERLADATRYVGTLEVSVDNAAIADLFVDNEYVGKLPRAYPIYVSPGSHVIFARNNTAANSVRLEIKKGETQRITLHILPPPTPLAPPVESTSLSTATYVTGGGISLALIGGGIYLSEAQQVSSPGAPKDPLLWAPFVIGGGIGAISMAILFVTARTKETPVKISGTILPFRDHWHVGLKGSF